jgi:hypothetical protein
MLIGVMPYLDQLRKHLCLLLKRASASRPSGEWNDDDFDVPGNGEVVGRIFKANAAPVRSPMWTLKAARQPTAMLQRARPRWLHWPRAGGANDRQAPVTCEEQKTPP